VLLICSLLSREQLLEYIEIADSLGLSALVEAHDEKEIETALSVNARIIGVNNRNLKDFSVDTKNSKRLRTLIPEDVLFVSESGVSDERDVADVKAFGADAVLIGEAMMKAKDKKEMLLKLKSLL
jgi:indole-3-glycerol phosphate synthase